MTTSNIAFICLLALTLANALSAADDLAREQPTRWGDPPAAVPLQNCDNHLDVPYSERRKTGTPADKNHLLNIHVPKGDGPFPCVIFLHGGGYVGGRKDYTFHGSSSASNKMLQRRVDAGFVTVNGNYPVGRGVRSMAWWELRALVRFLRANAAQYRLDPGKIAVGGLRRRLGLQFSPLQHGR